MDDPAAVDASKEALSRERLLVAIRNLLPIIERSEEDVRIVGTASSLLRGIDLAAVDARGGISVGRKIGGPFPGGGKAVVLTYAWPDPLQTDRSELTDVDRQVTPLFSAAKVEFRNAVSPFVATRVARWAVPSRVPDVLRCGARTMVASDLPSGVEEAVVES